jgi:PAS domain S-box-containing protein
MPPLDSEDLAGLGFEQVVSRAPVAISVIDPSGRVIHANPRAHELTARQLGVEMPADLEGAIAIFHLDGRRYERAEWPAVRSLSSGEEISDEEFFYVLPDAGRLFVRCSSSPLRGADGTIIAAVLSMTDVTEQRRQEERLSYLARLLDNTEDAIVAFDPEWFITVWNAGAERMYGWTADEVLGRYTLEVARLELSPAERTEVRLAVAERGRWRGEITAYRKDGAPVRIELIAVAVRGTDGEITGFLGIHRDLTEHRRDIETILESITDAFIAMDRNWRYTYVNDRGLRRMEAWLGRTFTREEVLGRNAWELFPAAVGTEVEQRLRDAMAGSEPVQFEVYFPPTGEWVEANACPSPDGLSVYYRNISARRRAEESLRNAQAERAEAERRLDEVRDAERSRIARDLHDEALQGLTHALAVTGRHAVGGPAAGDGEVTGILEQVGRQLRAAIYDLRIEAPAGRPFADALRDLVELTRERSPQCNVTLEAGDDVPTGSLGRRGTEVLRICGEALSNACNHADAGHIVLRVRGPDSRLRVQVTDDGHGFDLENQPPGILHGQGLRGMRERAELLGARLDVRSDETGTTVRLEVALSR